MASLTACLSYVFLNIQLQAVWGQHLLVAYGNHLSDKIGGISLIDVNNSNAVPISRNIGRAWFMAYHYNTSYIFWTEIGKSSIFRLRYPNNESNHVETVVKAENPRGIALDQTENRLYWTEPLANKIMRCNLDGSEVSVVLNSSLAFPNAIAIQSRTSHADNNQNIIERCRLDGSARQTFITESMGIGDVYDIAVDDAPKCTLYWTDSQLGSIKSSSCNGSNISIITSNNQSFPYPFRAPYSLDVDTNFIYFTDRASRHVFKVSKALQSQPVTLYSDENEKNGVVVFYEKVCSSERYTSSLKSKDKDEDASLSGGGIVLGYALGSVIFVSVTLGPCLVMLSLHIGNRLCRRLRKNRLQQNTQHNNFRMSSIEADYDTIADDKYNPTNISCVNEKCNTINESVIEKKRSDHVPALVTFVNPIKYENTVNSNPYISMTTRSTAPKYENTATQDTYMPMISRADTYKYDAVTDAIIHCSQSERPFTEKDSNKHDAVTDITVRCAEAERSCTEKLTNNQNYYNC
ncbi:LRP4 [Mytilus coruscus]|uniref:LRP4 n=1 Tax=Mytilus coruscus TaxID=42192 RepID=A0A6J8CUQ3_MYTCO|nr:LRP4 [Mytilus coruscus]